MIVPDANLLLYAHDSASSFHRVAADWWSDCLGGDENGPDLEQALAMLEGAGAGGGLATDALIAAIAVRHRATVHTADADFARFPQVRWYNPLTGRRG